MARTRQQRNDRRAAKNSRARLRRVLSQGRGFEDAALWLELLHPAPLATEAMRVHLLWEINVSDLLMAKMCRRGDDNYPPPIILRVGWKKLSKPLLFSSSLYRLGKAFPDLILTTFSSGLESSTCGYESALAMG